MRTFIYGLVGFIISIIFYAMIGDGDYAIALIVYIPTILCGCTGAIVSAILSLKEPQKEIKTEIK